MHYQCGQTTEQIFYSFDVFLKNTSVSLWVLLESSLRFRIYSINNNTVYQYYVTLRCWQRFEQMNPDISRIQQLIVLTNRISLKNLTDEKVKVQRSGLICVVCACTCGDPGFSLLLSFIISACVDESVHICSAYQRGHTVTRASYARMTLQDFFCAPSIPTLQPTDWLTALWLRPSLSQLLLSFHLSSLLVPVNWCEWMLTLGGFLQHCFHPSTQILIRVRGRGEGRKVGKKDLFGILEWAVRLQITEFSKGELGLCRQ